MTSDRVFLVGAIYKKLNGAISFDSIEYFGDGFPSREQLINEIHSQDILIKKETITIMSICELSREQADIFFK